MTVLAAKVGSQGQPKASPRALASGLSGSFLATCFAATSTAALPARGCVDSFVGLEPHYERESRYDTFTCRSRQRFAVLVDTGAQDNVVGGDWLDRYLKTNGLESSTHWAEHSAQFHGIGAGAAPCEWKATFPIGLSDQPDGNFMTTQVLQGCRQDVPALLGLATLVKRRAVLDFRKAAFDGCCMEIDLPCLRGQGHLTAEAGTWPPGFGRR